MVPTLAPPAPAPARSLARRRTLLALAPLLSAAAASALGFGTAYMLVGGGSIRSDGWDGLAAVVFFLLAGLALSVVGYIVAAIVSISVLQPAGARLAPCLVGLAAPAVVAVVGSAVSGLGSGPVVQLGQCAATLATIAALAVLLWVAGRLAPARWLAAPVSIAVAGYTLASLAGAAR